MPQLRPGGRQELHRAQRAGAGRARRWSRRRSRSGRWRPAPSRTSRGSTGRRTPGTAAGSWWAAGPAAACPLPGGGLTLTGCWLPRRLTILADGPSDLRDRRGQRCHRAPGALISAATWWTRPSRRGGRGVDQQVHPGDPEPGRPAVPDLPGAGAGQLVAASRGAGSSQAARRSEATKLPSASAVQKCLVRGGPQRHPGPELAGLTPITLTGSAAALISRAVEARSMLPDAGQIPRSRARSAPADPAGATTSRSGRMISAGTRPPACAPPGGGPRRGRSRRRRRAGPGRRRLCWADCGREPRPGLASRQRRQRSAVSTTASPESAPCARSRHRRRGDHGAVQRRAPPEASHAYRPRLAGRRSSSVAAH